MQKTIERQGGRSEAVSERYPRIIAGVCEYCGVIDPKNSSVFQYQLCPHFQNIGEIQCSYCPETVNPDDVMRVADIKVHGHPDNPNKLVVVCDSLNCSQKHLERFKINS